MTNVYHGTWMTFKTLFFWSPTSLLFCYLQSFFKVLLGHSPTCPLVVSSLLVGGAFNGCLPWLSLLSERHEVSVWLLPLTPLELSPQTSLLPPLAPEQPPFLRDGAHSFIQHLSLSAPPDLTEVKLTREDALPSFTNLILGKAIPNLQF